MIRFTRHSLYNTIISATILVVITMVVLFRTQISLAFGQKEGPFPNILLLGLIEAWTHRIHHKKKEIPKLQISHSESPFTTELTFETEVNAAGLLQGRA